MRRRRAGQQRRPRADAWLIPAIALATTALVIASDATAQTSGFALNRYDASERGSDWFSGESLDLRGKGRFAFGVVGDWAHKPLVTYDGNGNELDAVVRNQLFVNLGGSVILADRLRIGANLPVLLFQDGTTSTVNGLTYRAQQGANIGDARLGLDVRLFGEYGDPATLAVGGQLFLPTGSRAAFSGDGKVRFVPRVALAGDISIFAYSARVGLALRGQRQDFAGQAFGTDLQLGVTAGLRLLDKALLIGPELWAATVVSDGGDGLFERRTTPVEGVLGAHYFAGAWRFGVGAGPGFTTGVGSPAVRVLASVEWFPPIEAPAPPVDSDRDGILDGGDACPDVAGVATNDPATHGCPAVIVRADADRDGIFDDEDACVDVAGVANNDKTKHGCPLDSDGDGILDGDDACVSEPGVANDDKTKHGCPQPKDRDGDGILDADDACPDQAGPADTDLTKHGCPRVQITESRVVILDRIEFDTNKATIRPESDEILQAVFRVLSENPQLERVRVEGHTDNRGSRAHNVDLSQRRARSVVEWLVGKGIPAARLLSAGFGPDRPVDSNDTDNGRQNNRRVEFHIESKSGGE
jgi:OmpA-OmpF porin, OOP family